MSFHEHVNQFLGDPRVQSVRDLSRESRSLRICYPKEVPVSRFLAWLLDPTQGHGLQDGVLRALFIAAWKVRSDYDVDKQVVNFLSPMSVEAQSFDDCLIDREVRLDGRQLDVLVLEPKKRWLLAIEHKFGAREGKGQLKHYRKCLEALYPDWRRVLVFLDYDDRSPSDDGWIGLDYAWLVQELKTAEASPWLGASCKSVIRDFRDAVDSDGSEFELISEDHLLQLVNDHRQIFEQMREWSRVAHAFTQLPVAVFESSESLDAKATQQLYKVYWQRRFLWVECLPMLSYASLLAAAKASFPTVEFWPDRKCVYFRLREWAQLDVQDDDDDSEVWSLAVRVRPLLNEDRFGKDSFGVMSYVEPARLCRELRTSAVFGRFERFRAESMRKRQIVAEEGTYPLKAQRPIAADEVNGVLVQHLLLLQQLGIESGTSRGIVA
jgi:hypothetical protein